MTASLSSLRLYLSAIRRIPPQQLFHLARHRSHSFLRKRFPGWTRRTIEKRFLQEWTNHSARGFESQFSDDFLRGPTRNQAVQQLAEGFFAYREGRITFLNRHYAFSDSIWELSADTSIPELIRETLHYHSFLVEFATLAAEDQSVSGEEVWETIESALSDWRVLFPLGTGIAWNPFTTASRIQNWIRLHGYLTSLEVKNISKEFEIKLQENLFRSGLYLERNLELHLGGNHLMKDLSALAMLSGFFEGRTADRWFDLSTRRLLMELDRQILPDGGHYERSPMYHILVMGDLIDAAETLSLRDPQWVENRLRPPLVKMACFLDSILHSDGEIPFFGDSVLDHAPPAATALARVRKFMNDPDNPAATDSKILLETGLIRMETGGLVLVADFGRLGPDELLGHAHNDALSFELSEADIRWIVDKGVYEYESGERRQAARSILSHNTPCINGLEQSETWSSFRVGRRWHPNQVSHRQEGASQSIEGDWSRPGFTEIRRRIAARPDGTLVICDRLAAQGAFMAASPIHFGPGVTVEIETVEAADEGRPCWKWRARRADSSLFGLTWVSSPAHLRVEECVYWPRFYVEEKTVRLMLEVEAAEELRISVIIGKSESDLEDSDLTHYGEVA